MPQFDPSIDYYEILQVHPKAHAEIIKRAYRTIVKMLQAHPDLGGSHDDAVRLNEAYQVLSDPVSRKAYDDARARLCADPAPASATGPGPAPAPSASPTITSVRSGGSQTVFCPRCGARNRLAATATVAMAICGKCHASLLGGRRGPREPNIAIANLKLSAEAQSRLSNRGEISLQRVSVPSNGRLSCYKCHFEWVVDRLDAPPSSCPRCHSKRWSDFRIFECRHCHDRFSTSSLNYWPYWLFPECPSCHHRHWHRGCERHPFRWLMSLLAR